MCVSDDCSDSVLNTLDNLDLMIIDLLSEGGIGLEGMLRSKVDFEEAFNFPWHGRDVSDVLMAIAKLLRSGYLIVEPEPSPMIGGFRGFRVILSEKGNETWCNVFLLDKSLYIIDSTEFYGSTALLGVEMCRCTFSGMSCDQVVRLRSEVLRMGDFDGVCVSEVCEVADIELNAAIRPFSGFSFYVSAPCSWCEAPPFDRMTFLRAALTRGWRRNWIGSGLEARVDFSK